MTNIKKVTLIFAATFLLSTLGFIVSVILTTGFNSGIFFGIVPGGAEPQNEYLELSEEYFNININVSSSKSVIKPSRDNVTRISYKAENIPTTLEARVENDELYIREKWKLSFFNLFSLHDGGQLTIEIPEKEYNEILLRIASGSLDTRGISLECRELNVQASSGKMNISGIACEMLSAKISSGEIEIDGVDFSEYTIACSSGRVTVNNASGRGDVQVSSGDVTVNYADWNDYLNVMVSSGNVKLNLPPNAGMKVNGRILSGSVRYSLGEDSGKLGTSSGARFGGDNVQEVDISVSSGNVMFTAD